VVVEAVTAGVSRGRARLDGVTFEVAAGTRLAVVGPSGSGKTSLLQALAGRAECVEVVSGVVRVRGSCRAYFPNSPYFGATPRCVLALEEGVEEDDAWIELLSSFGANVASWRLGLDTPLLELPHSDGEIVSCARILLHRQELPEETEAAGVLPTPAERPAPPPRLYIFDSPPTEMIPELLRLDGTIIVALPLAEAPGLVRSFNEVLLLDEGKLVRQGNPSRGLIRDVVALVTGAEATGDQMRKVGHGSMDYSQASSFADERAATEREIDRTKTRKGSGQSSGKKRFTFYPGGNAGSVEMAEDS